MINFDIDNVNVSSNENKNIQDKLSALISTICHYSRQMYDNIYAPNFKFWAK